MCGFCTETATFRDLSSELKGEAISSRSGFLYPIHLQEAPSWAAELHSWATTDHVRGAFVALCRRWTDQLSGSDAPSLSAVLATDALTALSNFLEKLDYPEAWRWVLKVDGEPPDSLPIGLARTELDAYLEGWLRQPQPGDAEWDEVTLHHRFFRISAAFDIVARQDPGDARIIELATCPVSRVPSFDALDLWLQRRALRACVERLGISFINTHQENLRLEAVFSLVQSGLLDSRELLELRSFLRGLTSNPGHLEADEVVGVLDKQLMQFGPAAQGH